VFSGGLRQGITSVGQTVGGLVNTFTIAAAGIVGFGAAATAITRGLIDLEARVKSLGAAAEQLGVSFQTIQVLEEAASRAGTSLDAAAAGIQKFAARIDGARSGTGAAAEAFRELGISQEQLANTAPTELAAQVAAELGKIEDPARRAALQVDLLGKSGEALRRTFSEIPDAAADLEKFGAAISPEDRARIEALGPAFDGFGVALRGLGQSVITPFAGIVAGLAETLGSLINVVTAVAQAIGAVLGPVLDTVGAAFSSFANGINDTVGYFRSFFVSTDNAAAKVDTLRESVEQQADAIATLNKAIVDSGKGLDAAINKAGQFGQAGFEAAFEFEQALQELQDQANDKELNAEQYARGVALATAEFEKQIELAKSAADENQKLAEVAARRAQAETDAVQKIIDANLEQQRIEQNFGGDSGRFRAAQDLLKLTEEISRVENALVDARLAGDSSAIELAEARLDILRPVEANLLAIEQQLADSADEIAQGFTDGFDKAFAATATSLDTLIEKASQFGNEGAIAAQNLQQGIDELQERVRDGILGRPAYEAELAAQKELFNQRIADLDAIAAREQQQREAQFNAQVEANNRLQAVLNVQVPQRAAEAAGIQALERQQLAAENLIAIENQIALTRQSIEAAREQGDLRNAAARNNELKLLQDLAKQEKAIIDGKAAERQQSRDFLAEQSRAAQAQQQAAERGRQQQEQQQKEQQEALAEQEKQRAAEFERQTDRLRQLNSIGQQSVSSGDIRSTEGASTFVRAAAGQFDPAVAELRAQSKILNTIALGLARNLAALTGTPTNLGVVRV
jgi:hypothetical protein